VLPKLIVQQQPLSMQQAIASQHFCVISQQGLSPLSQVMQQPSAVGSQVQWQQQRLTWQTVWPLKVQQQEQHWPASILQSCCRVAAATSSSHLQCNLQPFLVFSNRSSHRGTTQQFGAGAAGAGWAKPCWAGWW
jgi:hypothetical protein